MDQTHERLSDQAIVVYIPKSAQTLWYIEQDYYPQHCDAGRDAIPPMRKNMVLSLSAASMKTGEIAKASLIVPALRLKKDSIRKTVTSRAW